jgi:transposase
MVTSKRSIWTADKAELQATLQKARGDDRVRINAVLSVAGGSSLHSIAKELSIEILELRKWIADYENKGVESLISAPQTADTSLRRDYSAKRLRKLIDEVMNPHLRHKLIAIASLYDGQTVEEVSSMMGLSSSTVYRWKSEFNNEGPGVKITEAKVTLDAELRITKSNEVLELDRLDDRVSGDTAVKVKALLLSRNGSTVEGISHELEKPRSWVISTIKAFNSTGLESLGVEMKSSQKTINSAQMRQPPLKLPEGFTVKKFKELAAEAVIPRIQERLEMLSALYLYKGISEAAASMKEPPSRLAATLKLFRDRGLDGILEKDAISELNADKLETIAKSYTNQDSARKLFALARVVRGETYDEVAQAISGSAVAIKHWMAKLIKYGPDFFPDTTYLAPEKPKKKSSDTKIATRIVEHRAKGKGYSELQQGPLFISAAAEGVLAKMTTDVNYSGRSIALALSAYIKCGDVEKVSKELGIEVQSLKTLYKNLETITDVYAEQQARTILNRTGATSRQIAKVSERYSGEEKAKLMSLAAFASGKSLKEACSGGVGDKAKLLEWSKEFAASWNTAHAMIGSKKTSPPINSMRVA